MEEQRIEGLWDCTACGNNGIRARFDSCPGCGKARGIETEFYLPDDLNSAALTAEEAAKTTNAPDWVCEFCSSLNRSDVQICSKCGGDRTQSRQDYGMLHKLTGKLFKKR